jgi:hypothetical protein
VERAGLDAEAINTATIAGTPGQEDFQWCRHHDLFRESEGLRSLSTIEMWQIRI